MWTWRAVRGKCGRSNSATWVKYNMLPFGFRMAIGIVAVHLLTMGKSVVQKCAVLLVSAMMEDLRDGAGGPTDLDANATSLQSDCFLGNGFVTLLGSISKSGGFPPYQAHGQGSAGEHRRWCCYHTHQKSTQFEMSHIQTT